MAEAFDAVDVIRLKRDGGELSDAQIDWTIDAYTRGAVADEQMSALAMAIFLNGMSRREISRWTAAMIASGDIPARSHRCTIFVGRTPCRMPHGAGAAAKRI